MRIMGIWYSTNITILNENGDRTLNATQKSKRKHKVVDLDYVEIKARKPIYANWDNGKILAPTSVKKAKHEANLDIVDLIINMETTITKWKHIFELGMTNGHYVHHHNGTTCKGKWGFMYGNYKRIHDYLCVTNHNENYWEMFVKYKATQGLSKNFNILFFELIDAFMNIKPCFNPHI